MTTIREILEEQKNMRIEMANARLGRLAREFEGLSKKEALQEISKIRDLLMDAKDGKDGDIERCLTQNTL